jgi:cytochrome c551/c552
MRARLHAPWLLLMFVAGACLPAFAPAIRAREHHAALSPVAADTTCLTCHAVAGEVVFEHGGTPVVPRWMITDPRGCVGCHDVKEPRR